MTRCCISPVISRSISKIASIRVTASNAMGEISSATLPLRAFDQRYRPARRTCGGHGPTQRRSPAPLSASHTDHCNRHRRLTAAHHAIRPGAGWDCFPTIWGEVKERGRWRTPIPGPIIAHIGPEPRRFCAPTRQEWHGRVVAMQTPTVQHMAFDQCMDRGNATQA